MSKTPPATRLIYLYHPLHAKARELDVTKEDFAATEARLITEGWSRKRFAQALYHYKHGIKTITVQSQIAEHLRAGWKTEPISDPAKVKTAHPDAVHPHYEDKQQAMEESQIDKASA